MLPDTGLARATAGGWHVLADVGPPCPRELPAHAHADTLSCVVHVDGVPLLIDTGTSTYAAGAVRDRERSTAAHNTAGSGRPRLHRGLGGVPGRPPGPACCGVVGRADPADTVTVEAAHDGYRACRPARAPPALDAARG